MHSVHPLADNLLARLQSYTPREGRDPLEDFCTEALAYCLRNHREFREFFLGRIDPLFVGDCESIPQIHTQLTYRMDATEEDEDEEEGDRNRGGRFDLVIESTRVVAVIEVKVWSSIRSSQLKQYRRELDSGSRFAKHRDGGAKMVLAALTPRTASLGEPEVTVDVFTRWWQIQLALEGVGCKDPEPNTAVCRQFAEFLREKGMAPMHIRKINSTQPMTPLDVLDFREEIVQILKAYRSDKRMAALIRNKIIAQRVGDKFYLVSYGKEQFPESVGYELLFEPNGKTALGLYLEGSADGEITEARLKNLLQMHFPNRLAQCYRQPVYVPERRSTWIAFCQPVDGDLDGNAEAIRDWLIDATLDLEKLGELLK